MKIINKKIFNKDLYFSFFQNLTKKFLLNTFYINIKKNNRRKLQFIYIILI